MLKERKNLKDKYSPEYLEQIKCKDLLGRLSKEEIKIAKANGLLRWDLWCKAGRVAELTEKQHHGGIRLAPIFDGYGRIDKKYKTQAYLIPDYNTLDKAN